MSGFSFRPVRLFAYAALTVSLLSPLCGLKSEAQTSPAGSRPVSDRVTKAVDESARVTLGGTVHPLAKTSNDRGQAPDGMKLDRLQVRFKRSDSQEATLKGLIDQMHTPGSANYHKWLTPDEFGARFGPSDADVAKVEGWLQSHGFNIAKLNPGRQTLEFSGTAGQFRDTFHAPIHAYQIKGQTRYANSVDPQIPVALAPVFGGFASLNNFPLKSQIKKMGAASYDPATHASKPSWTTSDQYGPSYVLAPADFAVQYDLNPLYNASTPIKGSGQSIAIVNEANIDIAVVNRYRSLFNLPVNPPQVIIDGNDPGVDGINNPYGLNYASLEAYLDVELAGAVAPDATVDLVIAADTALENGLALAAERAVYGNVAPVISLSFAGCEANLGTSNLFWSGLWEQAAAQGITVMVAAGDSGSAGCDNDDTQLYAVFGEAANGLASTPYNVAVGGTDFYYSQYADSSAINAQIATYWNTTPSNAVPTISLLSSVPEQPWNYSQFGLNASGSSNIIAGGGGASTCATGTEDANGDYTSCTGGYPKPLWQTGTGVPSDSVRDTPDLSLFASNGANYSYYPICALDGDCQPVPSGGSVQFTGVGGTSASSPAFAGIMALVDQKYGRQGQANYILYPMAAQFPSAFHDVVNGTNAVPCNTTTVYNAEGSAFPPLDCLTVNPPFDLEVDDPTYGYTTEGELGLVSNPAYNAGTGYDLASGLGTIDAANLVANWGSVRASSGSTTTLTPPSTSFAHGTSITISGSVTPASGGPTPTGDVSLMTSSSEASEQGQYFIPLSTGSNGSFSLPVSYLPGGTYDIWGYYPGDGKTPPSSSTPVQITVSPEASTTNLQVFPYYGAQIFSGATVSYGNAFSMTAKPGGSSAGGFASGTGTVAFEDNSATFNTSVINSEGFAANTLAFPVGSHSVTAAYSGDNSYQASTSSPVSFTVTQNTPYFNVSYFGLAAGRLGVLPVQLVNSNGVGPALPPTGTVTVTGGPAGTTSSASLAQDMVQGGVTQSIALFTIPANAVPGTYSLTFNYSGDSNYTSATGSYQVTVYTSESGLPSSISAAASPATASPTSAVLASATVNGLAGHPAPTGVLYFYTLESYLGVLYLPSSSTDSVTASIQLNSDSLFQGVNQIAVFYSGDDNYQASQTVLTIDNSLSDFSLIPLSTIVTVPSSGAINQTVKISSNNSFAGTVFLTCAGASGITCSIVPSVTLTAGGTVPAILTVNTAGVNAAGTYDLVVTGTDSTGAYIHNIGLQVVTPLVTSARQGPLGNLELAVDNATSSTAVSQAHALFVSGWAADPVDGSPLGNIKVYIDGIFLATPNVGIARPDVATNLNNPTYSRSGFNLSYNASNLYVGPHTAVVVATDAAGIATTLNTLKFTVKPIPGPPLGNLEAAADNLTGSATVSQSDLIAVGGWVADPADGSPLANVKVYIDGTAVGTPTLGIPRPDVAAYFHNNGYANAGFAFSYYAGNLTVGTHTVSVVAKDSGGQSTTFGPSTIKVITTPPSAPVGNLEQAVDSVTAQSTVSPSGTLYVGGWAADYSDNGPAKSVRILIDGTAAGFATLGQPRPDVAAAYNNLAWNNVGYSFNTGVSTLVAGTHNVTAIATDSLGLTTTFGPIPFTVEAFISTVAGNGITGYTGDGGPATGAELYAPKAAAFDGAGNLYIADSLNNVVRKVTPSGIITTIAGNGSAGYSGDGGAATSATLSNPEGLTIDNSGNLYIADYGNSVIRKVIPTGTISTIVGTGTAGYSGDGGFATAATLNAPSDVKFDSSGSLYIVDTNNCVIRKVLSAGTITTIAGNGTCGYIGDGSIATGAELFFPLAIAIDSSGNFFIADSSNAVIRKVTASTGTITTFAGNGNSGYSGDGGIATNAELYVPRGVALDASGNLFISDSYNQCIREVTSAGIIFTVAGNGTPGYSGDGGPATSAQLNYPYRVTFDSSGNLFIADEASSVIRKLTYSNNASSASTPAVRPVQAVRPTSKAVRAPQSGPLPRASFTD